MAGGRPVGVTRGAAAHGVQGALVGGQGTGSGHAVLDDRWWIGCTVDHTAGGENRPGLDLGLVDVGSCAPGCGSIRWWSAVAPRRRRSDNRCAGALPLEAVGVVAPGDLVVGRAHGGMGQIGSKRQQVGPPVKPCQLADAGGPARCCRPHDVDQPASGERSELEVGRQLGGTVEGQKIPDGRIVVNLPEPGGQPLPGAHLPWCLADGSPGSGEGFGRPRQSSAGAGRGPGPSSGDRPLLCGTV
jgi:hypothetical protein